MRELVGKIPTKDPNITEVVYLSEIVRCLECQRTVPWVLRWLRSKGMKSSRRLFGACATAVEHGFDYETKAQSLPISSPRPIRKTVAPCQ